MATLRDIKRKIDAVKKTQQITRAMNMVAAAKLRTTQQKLDQFVPYANQLTEIMNRVAAGVEPEGFPLLMDHEEVVKVELISITADRGQYQPDHCRGEVYGSKGAGRFGGFALPYRPQGQGLFSPTEASHPCFS